jgi:hypothetical protein
MGDIYRGEISVRLGQRSLTPLQTQWRDQYGDLVYANLAGTSILVINSPEAARDLLVERGAQNSDRPRMILMGEIVGWEDSPLICTYNHPQFKTYRRMMLNTVGSRTAVDKYVSMEEHEAHRFLRRVIDEPERLLFFIRKSAYSHIPSRLVRTHRDLSDLLVRSFFVCCTATTWSLVKITLSTSSIVATKSLKRPLRQALSWSISSRLVCAQATICDASTAYIGDDVVRYVPSWFPGTGWMRTAERMRSHLNEILSKPVDYAKEQLVSCS